MALRRSSLLHAGLIAVAAAGVVVLLVFHGPNWGQVGHDLARMSWGWAAVAVAFPDLFTDFEKACAERTLRDTFPEAWEAINGRRLAPGESRERDRARFFRDHAADWIVVSAIRSEHEPGFVEAVATLGGQRDRGTPSCRYLLPSDEYRAGSAAFGFVIDEARHRHYVEPSSFIGGS